MHYGKTFLDNSRFSLCQSVFITGNRYITVSKTLVYLAIVSVTTVGATIGGNAFIFGNQIDDLEHRSGLRMNKA